MDYDLASHDDFLGSAKIEVSEIVPGEPMRTWVRLRDEDRDAGALELEVALTVDKSRLKWAVITDVKDDSEDYPLDFSKLNGAVKTFRKFGDESLVLCMKLLDIISWTSPAFTAFSFSACILAVHFNVLAPVACMVPGVALLYSKPTRAVAGALAANQDEHETEGVPDSSILRRPRRRPCSRGCSLPSCNSRAPRVLPRHCCLEGAEAVDEGRMWVLRHRGSSLCCRCCGECRLSCQKS